jgi:uncharacterized membrane protein YphA (DoxX/SURF4 family)
MNDPILPLLPAQPASTKPPGCLLLVLGLLAGFAAGALAATAALTAQGSMNAEASTHIQP